MLRMFRGVSPYGAFVLRVVLVGHARAYMWWVGLSVVLSFFLGLALLGFLPLFLSFFSLCFSFYLSVLPQPVRASSRHHYR